MYVSKQMNQHNKALENLQGDWKHEGKGCDL